MREIVFDTETTGLSPLTGDRMVEIGCVELFNRCETGRTYHAYFNPDRPMPSSAEAVHGLSDAFLSDKPRFHETVEELIEFLGDCPLVAHNASFDFGFLNHELAQCGRPLVCMTRMVDTLAIARTRHPGAKHSLGRARHRPIGIEIGMERAPGLAPVEQFDAADLDHPVAGQRAEAGGLGIENDLAHAPSMNRRRRSGKR